ncbi:MAG TPA: TonB-dependent receptor [Methylophilaceae bacterium]|nr:TonB-dependent receptor [Methylophilaceae bacterium]
MNKNTSCLLGSLYFAFTALPGYAQTILSANSFADMSLEELGNIEITSVSKKPQSLSDAAASVFIINNDDIRRSGASTLPEALRLAPNLQVAQTSATGYAITARGLNGSANSAPNKLLVLIDGRSVYSPLFSGVFWDAQDVMLENVERIEVISGPGGTIWGINAVNGVINVITKSAKDTQGPLASVQAGNIGNNTAARYGGALGENGHFRVYAKSSNREDTELENGTDISDGWHRNQVGFRADWDFSTDQFSLIGNAFEGDIGQPEPGSVAVTGTALQLDTISISGVNLTAHWEHLLESGSRIHLQAYYDRNLREVPPTFSDATNIFDMQFQHTLKPMGRHSLIWGANYRYSKDEFSNDSPIFAILPAQENQSWLSLFGQDQIALTQNLDLTVGARVERNPYTGYEFLPDARLAWKVTPRHLIWAGTSRAVRAPSRLDADAFIPRDPPFLLRGGPHIRSEIANVYQLGYRGQISSKFNFEITAFHNDYDDLRTQEIDFSGPFVVFANEMEGSSNGFEMWGTYQLLPQWRISAGLTTLNQDFELKSGSNDTLSPTTAGIDPSHTWQIRSSFNISHDKELNIFVRHAGKLTYPDEVDDYTAVDARFGWQVRKDIEVSVIGQNLLGTEHAEYGSRLYRSELPRGVFLKLVWHP